MLNQNSRLIFSRLYFSMSILLYLICSTLTGIILYKGYDEYTSDLHAYSKILELRNNEILESEKLMPPECHNTNSNVLPTWRCTIRRDAEYDKKLGTYADSETSRNDVIKFEELSKPKFPWEQLWWFLGCLTVLPMLLFFFKRWVIWVTNTKDF